MSNAAPLFTRDNAREMQLRSAQSRQQNRLAAQAELERERARPLPGTLAERVQRTERQLDEIDREIDRALTGKDKLALIRSKAELLKAWQLLTGFPSPGTRKGSKSSLAIQNPIPQPVQSKPVTE